MRWLAAVALMLGAASADAQARVVFADIGPGSSGPILREALRRPHRLAEPDSTRLVITREVQVRGSLIVLGRNALIEGSVDGDVIVVNGDLFVRPGARIGGRAVTVGGGAYPSALAVVAGGTLVFRDNTFDIRRTSDGYELAYRSTAPPAEPPLLFPEVYGFRMPVYDRVNGFTVPFGPAFPLGTRGRVDIITKYRSNLGVVDPSLTASYQFTRRTRATLEGGRGTRSNDEWIWLTWVNSGSVLMFGDDTRNYYRADHGQMALHRLWEGRTIRWEPFLGASLERAWSVSASGGPWSVLGRGDTLHGSRPNPAIAPGTTASALAGTSLLWETQDLRIASTVRIERSFATPGDTNFTQVTGDLNVGFPTFGEQSYALDVHGVTSLGKVPPLQRFVYLGGSGTLPFLEMLSMGGGELLLIDQRYSIPITRITLGDFGNPTLQLRHRIAAAGLTALPQLETMLGVGIAVVFVRGEVQVNPATGKARVTAGFTFSR